MQVFELHFNPKQRQDVICDSFCYEPENVYEKQLGNLYIVGRVSNLASTNSTFLENLARVVKEEYYSRFNRSSITALKSALKAGNKLLAEFIEKGNVSWLGNLDLAIFAIKLVPQKKQNSFSFNFSKSGKIKLFLLRESKLLEIGQQLELQDFDPYPFKAFYNIATGRLKEGDRLLLADEELLKKRRTFIERILALKNFEGERINELLQAEMESIKDGFGVCFLLDLRPGLRLSRSLTAAKTSFLIPSSQLKKIISYLGPLNKRIWRALNQIQALTIKKINIPILRQSILKGRGMKWFTAILAFKKQLKSIGKKEAPLQELATAPSLTGPQQKREQSQLLSHIKNNLFLVAFFILILSVGFFIFQRGRVKSLKEAREFLAMMESKVMQAENLLASGEEKEANLLFQEAWQEISKRAESSFLKEKDVALSSIIEENLNALNNLEKIEEPLIIFDYGYQQKAQKPLLNQALFQASEQDLGIYLLESKSGEITKYPYNLAYGWGEPQQWLKQKTPITFSLSSEKVMGAESIAVDGSVWVLSQNNLIHRFYRGEYQETIELKIFPFLQNPTRLWTSPENTYLYLLEPGQNRLIVLNKKTGQLVKQFQSKGFDNLLDVKVSPDDKTIWLLNGSKVYQISNRPAS